MERIFWNSSANKLTREGHSGYTKNTEIDLVKLLNEIIKQTGIEISSWNISKGN